MYVYWLISETKTVKELLKITGHKIILKKTPFLLIWQSLDASEQTACNSWCCKISLLLLPGVGNKQIKNGYTLKYRATGYQQINEIAVLEIKK